jgi:arylsulfatase A-like enzyme
MPELPTLAQTFRNAGYQAYAVGKLHVFPQRDRIGFDDVLLAEEGRPHLGAIDDYDLYLAEAGHAGEQFGHGMNNNDYLFRPWHLPERTHVTSWITREAAKMVKRRDPRRPAFWHVSYTHPHPPLVPLESYLAMYQTLDVDEPLTAEWAYAPLPRALATVRAHWGERVPPARVAAIRRAFYALCTHIDHQLRVLFGTLREEAVLDDTIVMVTADHGDMLGDFGLWAKRLFYEGSAQVPMILMGVKGDRRVAEDTVDDRLVGLQDVMPTLLHLAGIPIPETVDGASMVGAERALLIGECREDANATRMAHDGRHKLIWYPAGSAVQLFDLERDPGEALDVSRDAQYADARRRLEAALVEHAYGVDRDWIVDGRLAGFEPGALAYKADRAWGGQRGVHFPPPPLTDPTKPVGAPG